MIDFRYYTFLALCEIKNYTKTADYLHITQPAVTQHIQYLEEKYKSKLFYYEKNKLSLTLQGKHLRMFLNRVVADTTHFNRNFKNINSSQESILFGATLSVGEYIMPNIISDLIKKNPDLKIHMEVNNTHALLEKLSKAEIDFAIVEGIFNKDDYHSILFSLEKFIPICSPNSDFVGRNVEFNEILQSPLILREKGSGTREILENILKEKNYSLNSFNNILEIGNMSAIKQLVANDIGITFLYELVCKKEIEKGELSIMKISEFNITRELNFVFLKNSFYESQYSKYFHLIKEIFLKFR